MFGEADLYYSLSNVTEESQSMLMDCMITKMSFEDDDVIMDIGCGTGDHTKGVILARIPKLKKIIAIDAVPEMIEFSRLHMSSEKIEYHVANIEDKSTLQQWEGTISKAFSVLCFQWLQHQREGFQQLHRLLKPKGEAALMFITSSSIWSSYPKIINDVKWNKYLKDVDQRIPESHNLKLGAEYYRQLLENEGFEVLFCTEDDRMNIYKDDTQMKAAMTLFSVLPSSIPVDLREEFLKDIFNHIIELNGRNSQGSPFICFRTLTVHVKKR